MTCGPFFASMSTTSSRATTTLPAANGASNIRASAGKFLTRFERPPINRHSDRRGLQHRRQRRHLLLPRQPEAWPTLVAGGTDWATYAQDVETDFQGLPPQHAQTSGATGTTGIYWWDTAALAGFRVGQLLDQDPVTGEQVTVAAVNAGPAGPAVTIASHKPGIDAQAVYDQATGVLVTFGESLPAAGTVYSLQIESMP